MTTLTFPKRFAQIVVDGVVYTPDKNGNIEVSNADHIPEITRLGGTVPDAIIRRAEQAVAPKNELPALEDPTEDLDDSESATLEIDGSEIPTESMTRPKMIEWLRENGVAVNSAISKRDAWDAVKAILEQGN